MIDGAYKFQELELQSLIVFKFDLDFQIFAGDNFPWQRGYLRSWGRVYDVHFEIPKMWLYDTLEQQTFQVFYWFQHALDDDYPDAKLQQLRLRSGQFEMLAKDDSAYLTQAPINDQLFKVGKRYWSLRALTAQICDEAILAPQSAIALRASAKGRALLEFMRAEEAALQTALK